jgi:hypothetical protein
MGCLRCSTPKSSTLHPSSPTRRTDGSACNSGREAVRGGAKGVPGDGCRLSTTEYPFRKGTSETMDEEKGRGRPRGAGGCRVGEE